MKKSDVPAKLLGKSKYKYTVDFTNSFKRDVVNCEKSNLDLELLRTVLQILATEGKLPSKYKSHKLEGDFKGYWECHIQNDWLMVWRQIDSTLTLMLTNTGTHAYIFGI
ncbi:RelE/StbE family addiction module toxin [Bacteroidia bacterium]|nr:RelE/StbE family addiction module toxin [Bacteroidia bacterium]